MRTAQPRSAEGGAEDRSERTPTCVSEDRRRQRTAGPDQPSSTGDLGEELFGDVKVGGDALHVVQILEVLDEPEVLAGALLVDLDGVLRDHGVLGAVDRQARLVERLADLL